jgi:hypothetical protein
MKVLRVAMGSTCIKPSSFPLPVPNALGNPPIRTWEKNTYTFFASNMAVVDPANYHDSWVVDAPDERQAPGIMFGSSRWKNWVVKLQFDRQGGSGVSNQNYRFPSTDKREKESTAQPRKMGTVSISTYPTPITM